MDWTDDAIVLAGRRQGEGSLILSLLTRTRGRQRGLVRGAAKSRQRGLYEPGNHVIATWNARLAEHLGLFRLEPVTNIAALVMDDPLRLACLDAATSLAETVLPERAPHPAAYDGLLRVLNAISSDDGYARAHLRFELDLLTELGFGLDLTRCAVTGTTDDLAYVSPRTGRAVSRQAAAGYLDRLLVLPRQLGGSGHDSDHATDLLDGLVLTGFFLERHALHPGGTRLPQARQRYCDRIVRTATIARNQPT